MKNMLLVLLLFFAVYINSPSFASDAVKENDHDAHHEQVQSNNSLLSGKVENGVRIIEVKASRYKFEPDPIIVKIGENVRLLVTSTDVTHGLAIPEFKVNVSVPAGETKNVEFVADKKGSFHAHCSVYCGPGHGHMHGALIVQ